MFIRTIKRYCDSTCMEIRELLEKSWLVVPAGSVEQHSANLPLSVDLDISVAIAERLCEEKNRILAPPFVYGMRSLPNSGGGRGIAGTVFLDGSVYTRYTMEILSRYIENGAAGIVILNGHYENYAFLCEAVELLENCRHCAIVVMNWWDLLDDAFMKKVTAGKFCDWRSEHAGIVETSLEMYLKPELVKGVWYEEKPTVLQSLYSRGMADHDGGSGALSSNLGAAGDIGEKIFRQVVRRIDKLICELEMSKA